MNILAIPLHPAFCQRYNRQLFCKTQFLDDRQGAVQLADAAIHHHQVRQAPLLNPFRAEAPGKDLLQHAEIILSLTVSDPVAPVTVFVRDSIQKGDATADGMPSLQGGDVVAFNPAGQAGECQFLLQFMQGPLYPLPGCCFFRQRSLGIAACQVDQIQLGTALGLVQADLSAPQLSQPFFKGAAGLKRQRQQQFIRDGSFSGVVMLDKGGQGVGGIQPAGAMQDGAAGQGAAPHKQQGNGQTVVVDGQPQDVAVAPLPHYLLAFQGGVNRPQQVAPAASLFIAQLFCSLFHPGLESCHQVVTFPFQKQDRPLHQ